MPALHASEKWVPRQIRRSDIKNAPYNPRYITEQAKKRLRLALAKTGLIGPITWNKRTSNIVGGHQRLAGLDAIAHRKAYSLTVAEVDMSEAEEIAANILLNNPETQGQWDFEKLGDLLKKPELDLEAAGMGSADVYRIIGDQASAEVLSDIAEKVEKVRELELKTNQDSFTDAFAEDYYLVVVFKNHDERKRFTDALDLDDERYVSGETVAALAPK